MSAVEKVVKALEEGLVAQGVVIGLSQSTVRGPWSTAVTLSGPTEEVLLRRDEIYRRYPSMGYGTSSQISINRDTDIAVCIITHSNSCD